MTAESATPQITGVRIPTDHHRRMICDLHDSLDDRGICALAMYLEPKFLPEIRRRRSEFAKTTPNLINRPLAVDPHVKRVRLHLDSAPSD